MIFDRYIHALLVERLKDGPVNSETQPIFNRELILLSVSRYISGVDRSIITPPAAARGHSAQVEMTLIVEGVSHRVKLLAPDYLLLETAGSHPPAEGELILEIDGNQKHRRVFLPKGLPDGEREVPVRHSPRPKN